VIPALDLPALALPALNLPALALPAFATSLIGLFPTTGEHHRADVELVLEYRLPGRVCVEDTNTSMESYLHGVAEVCQLKA
jgi:hypothetical protein